MAIPQISFVAAAYTTGSGLSATVPKPAEALAGDLVLIVVTHGAVAPWPAGLQRVSNYYLSFGILYKVIADGDPASWTIALSGSALDPPSWAAATIVYRGVFDRVPVQRGLFDSTTLTTDHPAPAYSTSLAVAPAQQHTCVVHLWAGTWEKLGAANGYTAPAGVTTRLDYQSPGEISPLLVADETADVTGSTPERTATSLGNVQSASSVSLALMYPAVAHPTIVRRGDGSVFGVSCQEENGRLLLGLYDDDLVYGGQAVVAEPDPAGDDTWSDYSGGIGYYWHGVRGTARLENPVLASGAVELLSPFTPYGYFGYPVARNRTTDGGATWADLGNLQPPGWTTPGQSVGAYASAWLSEPDGMYVWIMSEVSNLETAGHLSYVAAVQADGTLAAPVGAGGPGVSGVRVPARLRRLPDGSFAFSAKLWTGSAYRWQLHRKTALAITEESYPPTTWAEWAVIEPAGVTIALLDWYLGRDGLLAAAILKWPDLEWWVTCGQIDALGAWTFCDPQPIQIAATTIYGQWAMPHLQQTADGWWEFAYVPRVDIGDPTIPIVIRCANLAADASGDWEAYL